MTLTRLAVRSLLRNKLRTALTVAGVGVAIFTFMLLRTVLSAWTQGASHADRDLIVTRHRISIIMRLPVRYADEIRAMPHVKSATYSVWFSGKDPKSRDEYIGAIAVDHNTYFDVVQDLLVSPADIDTWKKNPRGAIVGDQIATKLGWKVGDTITLESGLFPKPSDDPWTFQVVAISQPKSQSADRDELIFHYDYLNNSVPPARQGQIGWITSRVDNANSSAEVIRAIDAAFADRDQPTVSEDERSFLSAQLAGISAVLQGLNAISLVVLVIMTLILGNTVAMGVRERTNEYGVLRALGFLPRHVAMFVLGEAALTGLLGAVAGLAVGVPFVQFVLGPAIESNMGSIFPYFRTDAVIVGTAGGLAILLGVASALLPTINAIRVRPVDALRRVA